MEDIIFEKKKHRLDEIFIMRMFKKLWKEIINNTIKWLTFCLAHKKCQKCEWNKMTYNEIFSNLSFEKIIQVINY
jgi:hypothetical protein